MTDLGSKQVSALQITQRRHDLHWRFYRDRRKFLNILPLGKLLTCQTSYATRGNQRRCYHWNQKLLSLESDAAIIGIRQLLSLESDAAIIGIRRCYHWNQTLLSLESDAAINWNLSKFSTKVNYKRNEKLNRYVLPIKFFNITKAISEE